jgi:hypothetical protein
MLFSPLAARKNRGKKRSVCTELEVVSEVGVGGGGGRVGFGFGSKGFLKMDVVDPDTDSIGSLDPDPGGQKWPTKIEKSF